MLDSLESAARYRRRGALLMLLGGLASCHRGPHEDEGQGSFLAETPVETTRDPAALADASVVRSLLPSPITVPVFNCSGSRKADNFVNFESGQVRPLAVSEDGKLLFVANTPANCLEIHAVVGRSLRRVSAIQVGLEPVAVAVRNPGEVWVVNHLSDSISIVDLAGTPRVRRTLQVGDEPRDVVFAGDRRERAFITTAYRGQNHPSFKFEDLRSAGIGRASVWVYDAGAVGTGLSGQPVTILSLFTDTPRGLAVSADGRTVYGAGFLSGNRTTTLAAATVAGRKPPPAADRQGVPAPNTGLMVKFDGKAWVDEAGTDWSGSVRFSLPDKDVFAIDAVATPPVVVASYAQVGTVLFNMAVNPVTGSVYVTNTDARNEVRFEGPGAHGTTVRGNLATSRITVIRKDGVSPVHLNPHVDFTLEQGQAIPAQEKAKSVAQPLGMEVTRDGTTAYVAAFGSGKVIVVPTSQLESGRYLPDAGYQIPVPGGPTAVALDPEGKLLFVYSRFDNVVSVIETHHRRIVGRAALYSPEPDQVVRGRPFLYDANLTSSNGTTSCASCHIFGDADALAWDLGDPDGAVKPHPLKSVPNSPSPLLGAFHPMKGPMLTQTLRGLAHAGPMHWRGDRTGDPRAVVNGQLESQEAAAFKGFNGAFVSLVGRASPLTADEMQLFTDFALSIQPPPSPIRNLDNSLTPSQARGRNSYMNEPLDFGVLPCVNCHVLEPRSNQFGTAGLLLGGTLSGFEQDFKVPGFRGLYQRVGMFGGSMQTTGHGDQVRGFGYLHDGSTATVDDFVFAGGFVLKDRQQGLDLTNFLMAYDTNHRPVVGQQLTLSADSGPESLTRLALLVQQAKDGGCRLQAHGTAPGLSLFGELAGGRFNFRAAGSVQEGDLRRWLAARGAVITFTCMPL